MPSLKDVFRRPRQVTEEIFKERIASLPVTKSGCRIWPSGSREGYAPCSWEGRATQVHRVLWLLAHGPLPKGERLVNRCGHKRCVTLSHWQRRAPLSLDELPPCPKRCKHGHAMSPEICTVETKQRAQGQVHFWRCGACRREANRHYRARLERRRERGMELPRSYIRTVPPEQRRPRRKQERHPTCLRGHLFTPENTQIDKHGYRRCKLCAKERMQAAKQNGAPVPVAERRTHCSNGHAFTPENTKFTPEGWRRCRTCIRLRHQPAPPATSTPALPASQTV